MFHIALYQPEIPQNTGNIVRLSVGLGADVHLIPPLGFSLEDRYLKRAGLDYWKDARVHVETSLSDLLKRNTGNAWFFSAHATRDYWDASFEPGDLFVFGQECCGLPDFVHAGHSQQLLTIPMWGPIRSLNLSNSVALVLYEAMRQQSESGTIGLDRHYRQGRTRKPAGNL